MSLPKNFIKYQSLGNDFVIFDWYKKPQLYVRSELQDPSWKQFVINTCNRHYGVGADGVLVITNAPQSGMPEMLIFNSDGTQATSCLNGLRCVAQLLFLSHHLPEQFSIKVGNRIALCSMQKLSTMSSGYDVITHIDQARYDGQQTVTTPAGQFTGHCVDVGNPHFIVFGPASLDWLRAHGKLIESHQQFPHRTNVEFIEELLPETIDNLSLKVFNVLVYERGCGITLACSSGAAAITNLLLTLGTIKQNQKIIIRMPGGSLIAWIDDKGSIALQAHATYVFKGAFE